MYIIPKIIPIIEATPHFPFLLAQNTIAIRIIETITPTIIVIMAVILLAQVSPGHFNSTQYQEYPAQ